VAYFASVIRKQVKLSGERIRIALAAGLVLSLALAFACAPEQKPTHILSDEEMVQVLMDIYLTEEKVNRLALPRDSAQKIFALFKERVMKNAHIPDSLFIQSMEYYMEHPKKLERVYTAVIDSLLLREQAVSLDTTRTDAVPR
jgi:hypothetical protein